MVNWVQRDEHPEAEPAGRRRSRGALVATLAGAVGQNLAPFRRLAARDSRAVESLRTRLDVDEPPLVPQLDGDVHGPGGLVTIQHDF